MGCLHQPRGSTQSVVPHASGDDMESRLDDDTLSVINGSPRAFARCVAEGMMSHARFAGACLSMLAAAAIGFGLVTTAQAETQLGRAYRIIAGKRFVDLTHSFGPNTPVWSGFGQAKMTPAVIRRRGSLTPSPRRDFAAHFTKWSDSTAPMSIRPRISPKTASPWIEFRSSR